MSSVIEFFAEEDRHGDIVEHSGWSDVETIIIVFVDFEYPDRHGPSVLSHNLASLILLALKGRGFSRAVHKVIKTTALAAEVEPFKCKITVAHLPCTCGTGH